MPIDNPANCPAATLEILRMKTVVGALLNFKGAWAAMEPAMFQAPHHKPPVHPVLYLKPANTWRGPAEVIVLPPDVEAVEMGATLGVVMGRAASRVGAQAALSYVGGYRIVNDVTVPHAAVLRPPLKQKCRDTFCPMGPVIDAAKVTRPDALTIRVFVNGELRLTNSTANLIRGVGRLIADVSEFMTLDTGDVLLVGVPENPPLARAGDRVAIEIDGLGRLENTLAREGVPR
jgi:5-oxopent-3-ene-1,2,5-tricarboxylate decarboxylase/2-hydroxyhepta-2,4-diene-1,7-dioate isomerase